MSERRASLAVSAEGVGTVMRRVRVSATLVVLVLAGAVAALRGSGVGTAVPPGSAVGGAAGGSLVTASPPAPGVSGGATGSVVPTTGPIEVRVSRNVDGDTIHVTMPGGADEKVRFIGVNTPESTTRHQPYGKEASDYTKARLPVGTRLWLETDVQVRDRYGRILAYVWTTPPSGETSAGAVRASMFNAELLLDGYAQLMTIPPDVKYVDLFRPLAAEARAAGRGLWGLPAP
jgi:micrococcal nuclease